MESTDMNFTDLKNEILYLPESIRTAQNVADQAAVSIVVDRIDALNKKPIFLFKKSDLVFVNKSLTHYFGPALVEESSGMNEAASRWMMVFEGCLKDWSQESHESHFELFLWLFTLYDLSDTLMTECLKSLLKAYQWQRSSKEAMKQRNRSLCRFRTSLLVSHPKFCRTFDEKLRGCGEFYHHCWRCSLCRVGLNIVSLPAYFSEMWKRQGQSQQEQHRQMHQERQLGAPLSYRG